MTRSPGCSADRSFRKRSKRCCGGRPADGIRAVAGDRLLAPNEYIITLGVHDYQKVGADPDLTSDAFAKHLAGYIGEQGWQTYGDVVVRFEQSANLHTGQFRTRGAVNPDVEPRPTAGEPAPPQSDHAFSAEPGVPPMTENSSYRGGQGQGRPGDDYYDDRLRAPAGRPACRAGPARSATRRSSAAATPSTAATARPTATGRLPRAGLRPTRRLPRPAAATPSRAATQHPTRAAATPSRATPSAAAIPSSAAATDQGGYPDSPRGGYDHGGYGGQRPDAGYGQAAATAHPGAARATTSTPTTAAGRPARTTGGYGAPDPRGGYPDQGGYDQGYGHAAATAGRTTASSPSTADRLRPGRYAAPGGGYGELRLRPARRSRRLRPGRLRPGRLLVRRFAR